MGENEEVLGGEETKKRKHDKATRDVTEAVTKEMKKTVVRPDF